MAHSYCFSFVSAGSPGVRARIVSNDRSGGRGYGRGIYQKKKVGFCGKATWVPVARIDEEREAERDDRDGDGRESDGSQLSDSGDSAAVSAFSVAPGDSVIDEAELCVHDDMDPSEIHAVVTKHARRDNAGRSGGPRKHVFDECQFQRKRRCWQFGFLLWQLGAARENKTNSTLD